MKTTIRATPGIDFKGPYGTLRGRRMAKAMLIAQDSSWADFEFQFPITNLTHGISQSYGDASSLSRAEPIQQWLKGDVETITFEAMAFAEHRFMDITDYVAYMKSASKKDEKLGRPPIWTFIYGTLINEIVVIESCQFRYGEPRVNANMGTPRDVYFNISLRKYTPFDIELTDPNALPSDTFYVRAKSGDTWEHLAHREYGDADLGDIVRRRNHDKRKLTANNYVKMPKFERVRNDVLTPESVSLKRESAQAEVKADMLSLRSTKKFLKVWF